MKKYFAILALILCGCHTPPPTRTAIEPPVMFHRAISPSKTLPPGELITLHDGSNSFTLFLPEGWIPPANGKVTLTVHFHGATWFAIQEHLRHGLKTPLLAVYLGEGSSVYRKPFEDRERFARWLSLTAQALQARGAPANTRITTVDISSFSAGYGAVREILKSPEYRALIRRVVLCDSMYASLEEGALGREPARAQIEPWIPFAAEAVNGKKTFVLTCSDVSTPYASSSECAAALIKAEHAPVLAIAPGSTPAASDPDFPLKFRSDLGDFHIWHYGGTNAQAHLTHVRHLADVWMALDAAKNP